MKKIILLPVIAVFIAIISVPTYTAFAVSPINFDGFADNTAITNQYQTDGAVFSSTTSTTRILADPLETTSPPNILVSNYGPNTGDIVISIVDPLSPHNPMSASSVDFWVISVGNNPVTVTAKDSGGNVISGSTVVYEHDNTGTTPITNGFANKDHYTFSNPDIRTITLTSAPKPDVLDGYGIDDLQIVFRQSTSIPEFPIPFGMIIIFAAVAAVYMGIRQKMIPGFKSF